jgi:hypothetical protein
VLHDDGLTGVNQFYFRLTRGRSTASQTAKQEKDDESKIERTNGFVLPTQEAATLSINISLSLLSIYYSRTSTTSLHECHFLLSWQKTSPLSKERSSRVYPERERAKKKIIDKRNY